MDGQDVGDVVLSQQLPVSSICGTQRKSRNTRYTLHPITNHTVWAPKLNKASSAQQQPPSWSDFQANVALRFQSFALVLNWKKNRKTSVSKTVQQLGPKARNSNCSNQILFFERKPNVFYLGQMCLEHFFSYALQVCRMLIGATYTRARWVCTETSLKLNSLNN